MAGTHRHQRRCRTSGGSAGHRFGGGSANRAGRNRGRPEPGPEARPGVSKSTAHRRFLLWPRAGVWGRPHETILRRLDDAGLLDDKADDIPHLQKWLCGKHIGVRVDRQRIKSGE
ncbi:hypothetical protein QMK19_34850 [Streptomyces sp. H10-C2]|nr:hypothetical protein [Streptomyces sp. H10-C2]